MGRDLGAIRVCECGFGTDSPVLWGHHRDDNPEHEDYDPDQILEPAPPDGPDVALDTTVTELSDDTLTSAEVAAMFGVNPKTLPRWERAGVLVPVFRTLGGHRRYRRSDVTKLFRSGEGLIPRHAGYSTWVSPVT